VEEAGGMRRVTAGRISTYWRRGCWLVTAVTCDISKVEALCHQNPDRAQLSLQTSENAVLEKFAWPHRPTPIGQGRRRGDAQIVGYYVSYVQFCGSSYLYIRQTGVGECQGYPDGGEQEKSRSAGPRRGVRGGRLNDELIVLPRRTEAPAPKGLFLSSPNGGFLHRGCLLPYQHGGGRGIGAFLAIPHSAKVSAG
jgi:hypothetical protein